MDFTHYFCTACGQAIEWPADMRWPGANTGCPDEYAENAPIGYMEGDARA